MRCKNLKERWFVFTIFNRSRKKCYPFRRNTKYVVVTNNLPEPQGWDIERP